MAVTPRAVARKVFHTLLSVVRHEVPDNLFWSAYEPRNFGDWMGPYLFQKMCGREPRLRKPSTRSAQTTCVAVGSIMRHVQAPNAVIWGAGIISREDTFVQPYRICAVRGPLTRDRVIELGYDCPAVYGDPAILLPAVYRPALGTRLDEVGLVPHFIHYEEAKRLYASHPSLRVVDATQPVEAVIDDICRCRRIVSSSLHGLIVAHAYGVPAARGDMTADLDGDGVKFLDYFASGGVTDPGPPLDLRGVPGPTEMARFVDEAPQPDLAPLLVPLLRACPFPTNWFES